MYQIVPMTESVLSVRFTCELSEDVRLQVVSCSKFLRSHAPADWLCIVPAMASIDIHTERLSRPITMHVEQVKEMLQTWSALYTPEKERLHKNIVEIPVQYGGVAGPDLETVAAFCKKTTEEVVKIHTSNLYPVFMIGFMPGFPYLGGLSPEIATPRKKTPRQLVPAGSVGIAGRQTGIYPFDSPGGWQIIGRTSMTLFQPDADVPSRLQSGDYVRFVEVN